MVFLLFLHNNRQPASVKKQYWSSNKKNIAKHGHTYAGSNIFSSEVFLIQVHMFRQQKPI